MLSFDQLPAIVGNMQEQLNTIYRLLINPSSPKDPKDEILTIQAASFFLELSVSTLRYYKQHNLIPYIQRSPKSRIYFSRAALITWLTDSHHPTRHEAGAFALNKLNKNIKSKV